MTVYMMLHDVQVHLYYVSTCYTWIHVFITYHLCCLVIYISDIFLKYTTISYFMYNVSLFLY